MIQTNYLNEFFEQLGMFIYLVIANVNWVFNISNKYLFGYFVFSIGYFCKLLKLYIPIDTFCLIAAMNITCCSQLTLFSQIILNKC